MAEGQDPAADGVPVAGRARELTRGRRRPHTRAETGRHHHLGAAPTAQPVHGEAGVGITGTAPVQLFVRTTAYLETQRAELVRRMADASAALDFEAAAAARDEITAIDAELARRA